MHLYACCVRWPLRSEQPFSLVVGAGDGYFATVTAAEPSMALQLCNVRRRRVGAKDQSMGRRLSRCALARALAETAHEEALLEFPEEPELTEQRAIDQQEHIVDR